MEQIFGFFNDYSLYLTLALVFLGFLFIGFQGFPLFVWSGFIAFVMLGYGAPIWMWVVLAIFVALFNFKFVRRQVITRFLMKFMQKIFPKVSQTEKEALDAGSVWIEKDFFSGKPNFKSLLKNPPGQLSEEEKAFLSGPVEDLCASIDEWTVWKSKKIPDQFWSKIKEYKFFGMIIPKEYGGLGFSASANSEVVAKLGSHSLTAAITVMVPNSLGPAELLLHYGTDEQKNRLLPKLATAEEIPCFALTEPLAGSDAGSMNAVGILFKDTDGQIKIKLNWTKRYITLASIATLIGIAFKLKDPDELLGRGKNLGITCALIPVSTPGIDIGRRHNPLYVPFHNCPFSGENVVISVDDIIGGAEMAGKGWAMLMDCLAAGRGISLPAQSLGGMKMVTRVTSAYAQIRKQFGIPIGQFEGIEEPLSRIAGQTYLFESARKLTLGALDQKIKPPVVTAIAKYYFTETFRKVINDGMDILGGAAISVGPRNTLAHPYIATPIGITVEGANILTRSMIIFGQGAMRAHPYAFKEIDAASRGDIKAFDLAFWGHVGHIVRNLIRAELLSLTRGRLTLSPVSGPMAKYYRRLSWASAVFAVMSDLAMGTLGGTLKTKEKLTGRLADILGWMYLGFSVLHRYEHENHKKEDLEFAQFGIEKALYEIQLAFEGIYENFRLPGFTWWLRGVVRSWLGFNRIGEPPTDQLTHKIAQKIQEFDGVRDRLTDGIYFSNQEDSAIGRYEKAFKALHESLPIEKKLKRAVRIQQLPKRRLITLLDLAVEREVITKEEAEVFKKAEILREDAVQVDDFSEEEYING